MQTKKINMGLIVFTIFISIAILVLTFTTYIKSEPMAVYTVYLDGKSIGTIASKDSFDEFVNSKEDELKKKYSELGLSAYNVAMEAGKELNYNNSTLLGLALNLSVFCYEVLVNPTEAIRISKETLEKGKKELLGIDEDNEEYRDSISIINLLQENLNMWTMDNENVI